MTANLGPGPLPGTNPGPVPKYLNEGLDLSIWFQAWTYLSGFRPGLI